jgi:predicted transcriptional regulator
MARDYKREYALSRNSKKKIEDNKSRKRARHAAVKAGKAKVNDGKDVDHKDKNPQNNGKKNTRVISAKANRGKAAGGGRPKGSKDKVRRVKRKKK